MPRASSLEVDLQIIELGGGRHLKLLDVVGKGASAVVYRALYCTPPVGLATLGMREGRDAIERPVAVKVFSSISSEDAEQTMTGLVRAVRRMAWVDHPNVARVYECGSWRARPFIITELVGGISLGKLRDTYAATRRRVPLDLALFIASEVAEALAGARVARDHAGVQLALVHHGLCASEVLLSWRGEVKLTDFGVCAAYAGSSSVRPMRGVTGRVAALAPEVAQGSEGDARSDVFALGVLLRELLIGPRFPPSISNSDAVRLAREGYVHPLTFQPHLPAGLVAIMTRALEVDPELRYPNACVMAADLRREVFAMGVGDGRYFLRQAIERDWVQYSDEITADRRLLATAPPPPPAEDEAKPAPRTSGVVGRGPASASTRRYEDELALLKRRK